MTNIFLTIVTDILHTFIEHGCLMHSACKLNGENGKYQLNKPDVSIVIANDHIKNFTNLEIFNTT